MARTSVGLKPMCATVCPSQALFFGPRSQIEEMRNNQATNQFQFGKQVITTKVYLMTAKEQETYKKWILFNSSQVKVWKKKNLGCFNQ